MSDMLAVLLGAEGGAASQAIGALSGGKSGVKHGNAQAGGEDAFMAVLFSRMGGGQGKGVQALSDTIPVLALGAGTEDAAKLPLQSLETVLSQVESSSGGAVSQAALATSLVLQSPSSSTQGVSLDSGDEASDVSLLFPVARGGQGRGVAKAAVTAAMLQNTAKTSKGMAETAADRQFLPSGQDEGASPLHQVRADMLQLASPLQSGSVVQNLAAQSQPGALDGLMLAPGQTAPTGVGQVLNAMGEAQPRATNGPLQLSIDAPVRSPLFTQELGERIVWLTARQGQVASIALNPPHLGPLEVRLSLSGGEAGAYFFSPHPQVRDALEAALPRLREMMAEAGMTLGQAQVRDETFSRQESFGQGDVQHGAPREDEGDLIQAGGVLGGGVMRRAGQGLVDLYV